MTSTSPYAARPWLRHYDHWVPPHLTYPSRPLGDILAIAAVHRPDGTATHFLGAELTFGDLKRQSDALAVALAELGIAKGDRVGIMLPNCPQYIVATFGILRLGAVVVNVNPSYTPREAAIVAADSGIRAIITLDALAPLVAGIRPATAIEQVIVTSVAEYSAAGTPPEVTEGTLRLRDLLSPPAGRGPIASPQIARDDLAVLQYTGGTTGTPKGAMLTHGNIFANVVQASSWTNPRYVLGGEERYLVVIPYFHIYAFSVCMMTAIWIECAADHPSQVRSGPGADIDPGVSSDLLPRRADALRVAAEPPEGRRIRARSGPPLQQRRRAVPGRSARWISSAGSAGR